MRGFALEVAKFPSSAVSISCHCRHEGCQKGNKNPVPATPRSLTIHWIPYKRFNKVVVLKVITECSPFFWIPRPALPSPPQVSPEGFPSWCLQSPDEEILICQRQAEIRSKHVCRELKAGDAQYDLSPWQIRPHYFHAIPCTGLQNVQLQRSQQEKSNLSHSGKQIIHSDILPQMRKGLFWGCFIYFTKC